VLPYELLLRVVPPPAEFRLFLLLVELKAVPVSLNFYLLVASGVSLLLLIYLLLLHYVNLAEDLLVVVVVKAVVAVFKKFVLGHFIPVLKVPEIPTFCC